MKLLTVISPAREIRIVESNVVSVETAEYSAIKIHCVDGTVYNVFPEEGTQYEAMNKLFSGGELPVKRVDIRRRM